MAHKCSVSGSSRQVGNRVSHANNKKSHVFRSNLQEKKIYSSAEKRFVRVKVSTSVLRTIDKIGLDATLKKYGKTLAEVAL
jgi:large subunit ribosomal protein L28